MGNSFVISHGEIQTGYKDDTVIGGEMTSCALVFGFRNIGDVICYHWFGFLDSLFDIFEAHVDGYHLTGITVVTNNIKHNPTAYTAAFKMIQEKYSSTPITYYTNGLEFGGENMWVILGDNDINLNATNKGRSELSTLKLTPIPI